MDVLQDQTLFLGVAVAMASIILLAGGELPFGETSGAAPRSQKAANAVLDRTTRPMTVHPGLFLGVAAGVTLAFLTIAEQSLPVRAPRPAPPAPCFMSAPGGFVRLGLVDSLENCGAQLEAVHLQDGGPVTGAYGGLRLFVDDGGIDTAQPHGPRARLIAPWMRAQIDAEIRRLIRVRNGETMQISVVRPR